MELQPNDLYPTWNSDVVLNDIENLILASLSIRRISAGEIVDVPELHYDFLNSGFTAREFSKGFVRLLMCRFLQPCGEFTYILTIEGYRACESALRLCHCHAGNL